MSSTAAAQTTVTQKPDYKPLLIVGAIGLLIFLIWRTFDNSRKKHAEEVQQRAERAVQRLSAEAERRQRDLAAAQQMAAAAQQSAAPIAGSEGRLIEADDSSFQQYINSDRVAVVLFYAPWCGHCKTVMPTFERLAQELAGGNFYVVRLNCDKYKDFAGKYGIAGFPTIKRFRGGRPMGGDYKGDRGIESLKEYARGP